ncbi:hypothetical protein ACHAXS_011896 [Conticribra weissflogii]
MNAMEFSKSGQIKSFSQIRADRIRHGLCDTCRVDPVQCFIIKRRFGGLLHEAIPLSIEHKVFNGICLACHPDQDPIPSTKKASHNHHLRHEITPTNQILHSDHVRRLSRVESQWSRIFGHRRKSFANNERGTQDIRRSQSVGESNHSANGKSEDCNASYDDMTFDYEYDDLNEATTKNIFGEPVQSKVGDKRKGNKRSSRVNHRVKNRESNNESERSHMHRCGHRKHHSGEKHIGSLFDEEKQRQRPESSGEIEIANLPGQPAYTPVSTDHRVCSKAREDHGEPECTDPFEDETDDKYIFNPSSPQPMDQLAKVIAHHCARTPQQNRKFVLPSSDGADLIPNSVLRVPIMDDDEISLVTLETALKSGDCTVITTSVKKFGGSLPLIKEDLDWGQQRRISNHQISEPPPPQQNERDYDNQSDGMDISTLREVVSTCMLANNDANAIEIVSEMLILDNDINRSEQLAMFCMTTLWILARKSDTNKHKIIFEGRTLEAIVEAMTIHKETSLDIQTRACGLLWSLAMNAIHRKHIANLGGCNGVLNAMMSYEEVEYLQVMALGALKVISLDTVGQSTLILKGTGSIVAKCMASHPTNATIQSEGCAILCNLARDADQSIRPVSEREIEAVMNAILYNPDSSEVIEGACFALLCFASSTDNIGSIRNHPHTRRALEISFQNYPEAVGEYVQIIFGRLRKIT